MHGSRIGKALGMIGILAGISAGAAVGYAYYRLVGCATGACPITSNPWIATIYGAVVGGLLGATFRGG